MTAHNPAKSTAVALAPLLARTGSPKT